LSIIDINDPVNPTEVGYYGIPNYANDIHVSGNNVYIASRYGGLRIIDNE